MPEPMGGFEFWWPFLVGSIIAYLIGSIPFGILVSKYFLLPDPRKLGSKNIGATNVLRSGNKIAAGLTLLLDCGKGAGPVIIGWQFGIDMAFYTAIASVLGHIFPIWLRFKGGKGVATSIGVLLGACWPVGVTVCGVWLFIAYISRYSSLSAIIAIGTSSFAAWLFASPPIIWLGAIIGAVVILKHHGNIIRLIRGTETKITFSK